jgi:hypothetical protein
VARDQSRRPVYLLLKYRERWAYIGNEYCFQGQGYWAEIVDRLAVVAARGAGGSTWLTRRRARNAAVRARGPKQRMDVRTANLDRFGPSPRTFVFVQYFAFVRPKVFSFLFPCKFSQPDEKTSCSRKQT